MSQNLMDTEIGGEQTQYEGSHAFVEGREKQTGQFGDATQSTRLADKHPPQPSNAPNTQGITPAEKIRYGQSIQEGGAGGKTVGMGGVEGQSGFGGAKSVSEGVGQKGQTEESRRAQGYSVGGEGDEVGA